MTILKTDSHATCVHEMFQEQARATPEAVAVVSNNIQITFRELNEESNRVACYLRRRGVLPEHRVALWLEHSIETIVAILGVSKAGGVYVAVDSEWPVFRISKVLNAAGVSLLVVDAQHRNASLKVCEEVLDLSDEDARYHKESSGDPPTNVVGENLFNIVYTSGSTGEPQGVLIPIRSVTNRIRWMSTSYAFQGGDLALLHRSFSTIGFSSDCFSPLVNGVPLFLVERELARDPLAVVRSAIRRGVSHVSATPALLHVVMEHMESHPGSWPTLRLARTSGDRLSPDAVEKWRRLFPGVPLLNVYGATECGGTTVYNTATYEASRGDRVPVGRPMSEEVFVYVLDDAMHPVPASDAGEIYVAGPHLARGYADSPGRTAERFLPNPDPTRQGERLFRTGDIGVLRSDGVLEIVGRADRQVKIRGYRVAVEEVETALGQCAGIRRAAVVPRKNSDGATILVAYLVVDSNAAQSRRALRVSLSQKLPAYMVPTQFVVIEAMPLTTTGKIDRSILPSLAGAIIEFRSDYIAPRSVEEQLVAAIWAEVLGWDDLGIDDDFFDLGGDSLLATRIASRISFRFGIDMTTRALFDHPTIRTLAEAVRLSADVNGNADELVE